MTRISPGVEKLLDEPTDAEVDLLVGVSEDASMDVVVEVIGDLGGEEIDTIGRSTVLCTVKETDISEILKIDGVIAIEQDEWYQAY